MNLNRVDFLIRRDDLRSTDWAEVPSLKLKSGQARLRVDRVALTANNITYAVFGNKLKYWDFFPAPHGLGRLPVWGFADVAECLDEGLRVGERIYGYFPMSSELVVDVEDLAPTGFSDGSIWRTELSASYNRYLRVSEDPAFAGAESEALQAAFRPLFATSFLIDEFLAENGFFGAECVLVSSASAKTSLALAYLLKRRNHQGTRVVGLTSRQNREFVMTTGFYDQIDIYEEIGLSCDRSYVFIDVAGSGHLRAAIHHRFGDSLRYSCAVGSAHWQDPGHGSGLPGPRPKMFFAPAHVDEKAAAWGLDGYERRLSEAWNPFQSSVEGLLEVTEHSGQKDIMALYHMVLEGHLSPRFAAMADMRTVLTR